MKDLNHKLLRLLIGDSIDLQEDSPDLFSETELILGIVHEYFCTRLEYYLEVRFDVADIEVCIMKKSRWGPLPPMQVINVQASTTAGAVALAFLQFLERGERQ